MSNVGFRGKSLIVDASIPKQWFKAGETVPVTLIFTPNGYKKVLSFPRARFMVDRLDKSYLNQSGFYQSETW